MTTPVLYGHPLSGHAHRAHAFLKLLGVDFESKVVDLAAGDLKKPDFLALNPLGQIPVYVEGDTVLRDSTAILVYAAKRYDPSGKWLPSDPVKAAEVQAWLATASKEMAQGPAAARIAVVFGNTTNPDAIAKTETLFDTLLEPHLAKRDWLVGDGPTIADIANYSYTAMLVDTDIDLGRWPAIAAWVKRVEAIDGFLAVVPAAELMAAS